MSRNTDLRELTLFAAVGLHHPNFQPATAIRLKSDIGPIGRKKGIDVEGPIRSQLRQSTCGNVNQPDISVARPSREKRQTLPFARPLALNAAPLPPPHIPTRIP